jgi:hypothetical protein
MRWRNPRGSGSRSGRAKRVTGQPDPLGLNGILFRYALEGRVDARNGSVFICPLPGGPLRFLHKTYGGGERNQPAYLEHLFGFALPEDYLNFMRSCNGATLFDNHLYLYGVVPQLNRGLGLEDQLPISLASELETSRDADDPGRSWRPFGSVAGYGQLFQLEVDASGRARMRGDAGPTRTAESVPELVHALAAMLDGLADARGFPDDTIGRLDSELAAFVESSS